MASGDTIEIPVPCHDDEHLSPSHELQNEFRNSMSEAKLEVMTMAKAFMRDLATDMHMNFQLNHQWDIATNATDMRASNVDDSDAASPSGAAPLMSAVSRHSGEGNQECLGANFHSDHYESQGCHFLPDINVNENDYERHGTRFENQRTYDGTNMDSTGYNNIKIPPFTGKEKWKIWYSRFTEVARLKRWNEEQKLVELLPQFQGRICIWSIESLLQTLISELESRFRITERSKTFRTLLNKRDQMHGKSTERYAAELKRLYDKAYPNMDRGIRSEDLVRRYLSGL